MITGKVVARSFIIAAVSVVFAELMIHLVFKLRINTSMQLFIPIGAVGFGGGVLEYIYEKREFGKILKISTIVCVVSFLVGYLAPRTDLLVQGSTGNRIGAMGNYHEVGGDNGLLIFAALFVSGYTLCLAIIALRQLRKGQ